MKPDARIFGTSNGIISAGYPSAIRDCGIFSRVINHSLGASPCSFLPYRLVDADLRAGDVVFVESLVNDAGALRARGFAPQDIALYYGDFLRFCADRAVSVVGILLPGRVRDLNYREASDSLRSALDAHSVEYWDGERWLAELAANRGVQVDELYRDAAHVHSDIIRDLFSSYLGRLDLTSLTIPRVPRAEVSIEFVPVVPNPGSPFKIEVSSAEKTAKTISTKLLSASSIALGAPFTFSISGPADFSVKALVLNSNNTSCYVRVDGVETLLKSFAFELIEGDDKIIVSSFMAPVTSANGTVEFSSVLSTNDGVENSYQAKKLASDSPRLELVGAILAR